MFVNDRETCKGDYYDQAKLFLNVFIVRHSENIMSSLWVMNSVNYLPNRLINMPVEMPERQ